MLFVFLTWPCFSSLKEAGSFLFLIRSNVFQSHRWFDSRPEQHPRLLCRRPICWHQHRWLRFWLRYRCSYCFNSTPKVHHLIVHSQGHCTLSSIDPPLGGNGGDGPSQMTHFAQVDKFNIFRLPVAWQYLQDTPGAPLNTGNLGTYDQLMQACLKTGAHCILDIHNYARWDGKIIGQPGGPTNDQFADVWSQLATKYATEGKVVMGLMNEPHDCTYCVPFPLLNTANISSYSTRHWGLGHSRPRSRNRHPQSRRQGPNDPPSWHGLHFGRRLRIRRFCSGT